MGRYINTETPGKERNQLSKGIVLAIRHLMQQAEPNETSKDLAAFIALALLEIYSSIDASVGAWEKKGYWVKADRFRLEWEWTESLGNKMKTAVLADDWATVAVLSVQIAQKFKHIEIAPRNRLGTPWQGAWKVLTTNHS